jgi:N-acetylglutamate synthase-like GNAT family acetyltransferase
MVQIRPYVEASDFDEVQSWWVSAGYPPIWKALLPQETTYVLEKDGMPSLCACLYLMNAPDACMIENLVANPRLNAEDRHNFVPMLFEYLESEARKRGYKTIVLFSPTEKLKSRYMELGFVPTATNITTFAKTL